MSEPTWQEQMDRVFGGGKAPEITEEKPKHEEMVAWDYPEKPKRKPFEGEFRMRSALPIIVGCAIILLIVLILSVGDDTQKPCAEMLEWSISKIPARCLAELSEMKPR